MQLRGATQFFECIQLRPFCNHAQVVALKTRIGNVCHVVRVAHGRDLSQLFFLPYPAQASGRLTFPPRPTELNRMRPFVTT
jgi:hypothetical protein